MPVHFFLKRESLLKPFATKKWISLLQTTKSSPSKISIDHENHETKTACPVFNSENHMLVEFYLKKQLEDEGLPSVPEVLETNNHLSMELKKRSTHAQLILPPMKTLDRIFKNSMISSTGHMKTRKSIFFEPAQISNQTEKKKTFNDVITNFYLTKKFVSILQRLTSSSRPKYMSETQFNLIGDPSFCYAVHQEMGKKKYNFKNLSVTNMMESVKRLKNAISTKMLKEREKIQILCVDIPVFHPFAKFVLFWDVLNLIIFAFMFMIVPIDLGFGIDFIDGWGNTSLIIKFSILGFYFVDILASFNQGYYKKGTLIHNRRDIVKKYLKKKIWLDLLSFFVIFSQFLEIHILSFCQNLSHALTLLYFVKFFKMSKIVNKIEELLVIDQNYFNVFSLCLLVFRLIVVGHVAACIWHFLASQAVDDQSITTWLTAKNLVNEEWTIRYLYSFYYILITMNTVGYGDITPQNPREVLFCVFFVFVACIMFGYCINCVGTIFQDFYKRESEFKKDVFTMNDFMKSQNIPKELQIRIRKYLEHLWKEDKIHNTDLVKPVWNKLSDSLKYELLFEVNAPTIRKIDLFCQNFSEKTLRELIKLVKEERFTPGDIIFNQGDKENKDLFLIKKGCVQIFIENELKEDGELKILKELKPGELFGEIAFFLEQERSASAKSKDFTTLIRIDQKQFKTLIEQNDIDREKFSQIKDSVRLYSNYNGINLACYSCNLNGHLIFNCPKLHRVFLKDLCILKHNYSSPQIRSQFKRHRKKLQKHLITEPKENFFVSQFFSLSLLEDNESENDNPSEAESGETSSGAPRLGTLEILSPTLMERSENFKNNLSSATIGRVKKDKDIPKKRSRSIHFADDEKADSVSKNFEKSETRISSVHLTQKNLIPEEKALLFLNMEAQKSFQKYFPHNNVMNVINEINRKLYNSLRKKKKTYLLYRSSEIKEIVEGLEQRKSTETRELSKFVKDKSIKKNVLRKQSVSKAISWKQALQMMHQEKEENEKKEPKQRFFKVLWNIKNKFKSTN